MAHIRRQIRTAVVDLLTGLATTGANVYHGHPYPAESYPCLFVYTHTETIELDDDGSDREQERRITFVVEGQCKAAALQDQFDNIAEEVETAMFTDQFLGGLADGVDLDATEENPTSELEGVAGTITMTFTVHTRTAKGAPGTAI